jgi:hypothetical protein
VNIQLVMDRSICYRASAGAPAGEVLLRTLVANQRDRGPPSDTCIAGARLAALRDEVSAKLRRTLAAIRPVRRPSAFTRQVAVLGTRLDLYARDPDHAEVIRLAELAEVLESAVAAQHNVTVYFVPELDVAQFLALSGIKASTGPFTNGELRLAARHELARLKGIDCVTDDAKALYDAASGQLDNDTYLARSIDLFVENGLLSHNQEGLLSPTTKLQIVVL